MTLARWTRRRLARIGRDAERGLTIVEVVVAGMILVLSGLGVLGIVDAATRNTFRAEQSQIVANVLQREMEEIKQRPYEDVALEMLPAQSGGTNDPRSRISGTTFDTAGDGTGYRPLVYEDSVNGGETVACAPNCLTSGPDPFQVDDVSGEIFRYVVWEDCDPSWLCEQDGEKFQKRVIVAVKLDTTAPGGSGRRYQEIQGNVVDPDADPVTNPGPAPGGDTEAAWTLFLTDTPCNNSTVVPTTASHNTHNTRGQCVNGLQEADTPGAPDLLWDAATEGVVDVIYDYALDVEPQPDADEGLQVMEGDSCAATPAMQIASSPETGDLGKKIHKWVSPPIPAGVTDLALTGAGVFWLWSRTVAGVPYGGEVCAWLFVRDPAETTDTPVRNTAPFEFGATYFSYDHDQALWPFEEWDEIAVPLFFEADTTEGGNVALPEGSRLGVAISVIIPNGTGDSGLQFLYDVPVFDSRVELETTGALPGWSS